MPIHAEGDEGKELPNVRKPKDLAKEWGCSERTLRKMARDLGACHVIGKTMLLTEDDVRAILEAAKPAPRIKPATAPKSAADVQREKIAAFAYLSPQERFEVEREFLANRRKRTAARRKAERDKNQKI